ncbi:MAG: DNA/RNA nuclease SfsA [Treponema sp.]|jgi:sugar fermentation stimulation protein A|nr:DNA/RNA nuclease SfsA [Treponema sp.]
MGRNEAGPADYLKGQGRAVQLFSNDLEAVFVRRPNRFLIIAEHEGREIPCHCPNPGRLIEFFGFRGYDIPGIKLILERRTGRTAGTAKTAYTAGGIYYRDGLSGKQVTAPLFSSRANRAAEVFILKEIIPDLVEIKAEHTLGDSRFDFLCTGRRGRRHLVEVKACSLVEEGIAMFPDAPSSRALKHLEELARLSRQGYLCHVLFVIVHSGPAVFIPNLHTDPTLAAGLFRLGRAANPAPVPALSRLPGNTAAEPGDRPVLIHAALLRADNRGMAVLANPSIPVDLSHGALAEKDGGNYLIVIKLTTEAEAEVGSLGWIRFKAGWYVYTGSARKNLQSRVNRHLRKIRKQKHWHLDYLTPLADTIKALPIFSYRNLECDLARELSVLGGKPVQGFGASDCKNCCPAHLYYFRNPPLGDPAFGAMLFRYRHGQALKR